MLFRSRYPLRSTTLPPSPSEAGTLSLTTRLIHESGEWIEDTATMPLPRHDPQGFGSAMTYCRRYALAAAVGVYQDDDDANAASGMDKPKAKGIIKPTAGAYEALEKRMQNLVDKLAAHIKEQFEAGNEIAAYEAWHYRDKETFQETASTAVWDKLSPPCRRRLKEIRMEDESPVAA